MGFHCEPQPGVSAQSSPFPLQPGLVLAVGVCGEFTRCFPALRAVSQSVMFISLLKHDFNAYQFPFPFVHL